MVAVKAGDVARLVARVPAAARALLVYGRDAGQIAERARAAARGFVADPDDPFQLVRLDDVSDHPGRLAEEIATYGLFGARRSIWTRAGARDISAAVAAALAVDNPEALLVVEAGDLAKTSPLRTLCEKAPNAYALPCYEDETRDLATVVAEAMRAAGATLTGDAQAALIGSLGENRLASRSEIDKLLLYAGGGTITLEDVEAVVSDVSAIRTDAALDHAFLGEVESLDAVLAQLRQARVNAGVIVTAALRHALDLAGARARIDGGQPAEVAITTAFRGLSFRRKPLVQRQVRLWEAARLRAVATGLQTALLRTRQMASLADPIAADALTTVARRARQPR